MRTAVAIVVLATLFARWGFAQSDATTRPVADDIRTWFKQLSDPIPEVRDRARTRLMTMTRARLPELKRIVDSTRPLSAAQAVELWQIVEHVFLSGEPYMAEAPPRGFMGVEMTDVMVPDAESTDPAAAPSAIVDSQNRSRVMVTTTIPGFAAYPVLRNGDIVLAVVGSNVPMTSRESLGRAIISYDPGQTVELEIQRAGSVMRVPIRLSRRPFLLRNNMKDEKDKFIGEREEAVTTYWEKEFAGLLDPRPM